MVFPATQDVILPSDDKLAVGNASVPLSAGDEWADAPHPAFRTEKTIGPGKLAAATDADLIWQEIIAAAVAMTLREPRLQFRVRELVLERVSLADAIAKILARRMACGDMREPELHALLKETFEIEKPIMTRIAADLIAVKARDPACQDYLHVLLNMKGFHALETHRISHALWQREQPDLAFALANMASLAFCVDIHPAARIGAGVMFDHGTGIVVGETAEIGDNVSVLQNVTLGGTGKERGDRHPKIRNGVLLGAGAKVLGNIEVGSMCKVAAGSVVLESVPPHCTVAGVPARVVRRHAGGSPPAFDMDQSVEMPD
ncbi:MAG TPA: serine O-acetyltransferase [Burkholderiaceae bacterium]|nr:serine O-acetyltransferase [Burkholderiaceae bacterium]